MKLVQIRNHVRHLISSKLLVGSIFVAFTVIALGGNLLTGSTAASAQSCSGNDIMPCGAASINNFAAKYSQDSTGDLHTIYSAYGLASGELNRFITTAKLGAALKNGDITVDGKVVATDATSIGRDRKAHSQAISIAGKTYYSDRNQDVFLQNSIPAFVMMNGDQFEFAALTPCGNPLRGRPTGQPPRYSCDMLNMTQDSRTTFSFTTKATALHGATITKLVYDFGDKSTQTTTSPSQVVKHTYAKPGPYTITVTVHVSVNGQTKLVTSVQCSKKITVQAQPTPPKPPTPTPPTPTPPTPVPTPPTPTPPQPTPPAPAAPVNLPKTGAVDILGGAVGTSSLATAGAYFVRSRRNVLGSIWRNKV